jgi:HPt (histidine-containing phosphotransfer) domain-containing protein
MHTAVSVDVDEAELLARLGGRRDLLAMLVGMFSSDLPQVHEEFAAAQAAGDAVAVRRLAHRVVGTLANLSAMALIELGRDIEEQATPDTLEALRPTIAEFLGGLDRLDERLRALVA